MPWNKYHATKVVIDGIEFDSKKEARRYQVLKQLESAGNIQALRRQVEFTLIPTQKLDTPKFQRGHNVNVERGVKYIADFAYIKDGKLVIEDTKGLKTPEYVIKRKLMKFIHNIEVVEI